MTKELPSYSKNAKHWSLDKEIVMLNHGSFGATPTEIMQHQQELRNRMESEPVRFMVRELEPLWWEAKNKLGEFIGARGNNLVFVKNATMGVNTILHALNFNPGDEILTSNHIYGACLNTLKQYAKQKQFNLIMADIPFPIAHENEVIEALIKRVTPKTKLLLIDHITSATGIIFPIERIVHEFESMGIEVLVDGAHAPGFVDLDLDKLGASYYVGNCHKWICSPKGSALMYVRPDNQAKIMPLQFSHVYDKPIEPDAQWSAQFFWPGTDDFTAFLCVPHAIEFMGKMMGDWESLRAANKALCVKARTHIAKALGTELPAPENMIANLSNILIGSTHLSSSHRFNAINEVQNFLFETYKIEVPVFPFGADGTRLYVRIAVQAYNSFEQYVYLADALQEIRANTDRKYL